MGLSTIDSHSQKEHTEIHKIPKFGVNQASFSLRYSDLKTSKFTQKCILTFSNGCISVKTSLINTKRRNLVNLGKLFLTM